MEQQTTRERFYIESLKLFHEKGFKATTMRDIAKALNIEAATLYNYVKSKQMLLDTFLFDITNKFRNGIENIESSSYPPLEKLKLLIALHVRLTIENPYLVGLSSNDWRHLKSPRLEEFVRLRKEYEHKFQTIVKQGIDTGALRSMNLEIATYSILSAIRWLYTWYTPEKSSVNPIELEKQMIDFVLKGVCE